MVVKGNRNTNIIKDPTSLKDKVTQIINLGKSSF